MKSMDRQSKRKSRFESIVCILFGFLLGAALLGGSFLWNYISARTTYREHIYVQPARAQTDVFAEFCGIDGELAAGAELLFALPPFKGTGSGMMALIFDGEAEGLPKLDERYVPPERVILTDELNFECDCGTVLNTLTEIYYSADGTKSSGKTFSVRAYRSTDGEKAIITVYYVPRDVVERVMKAE